MCSDKVITKISFYSLDPKRIQKIKRYIIFFMIVEPRLGSNLINLDLIKPCNSFQFQSSIIQMMIDRTSIYVFMS